MTSKKRAIRKSSRKNNRKNRITRKRKNKKIIQSGGVDHIPVNTVNAVSAALNLYNSEHININEILTQNLPELSTEIKQEMAQQALNIIQPGEQEQSMIKRLYDYIRINYKNITKGIALILATTLIFLALKNMDIKVIVEHISVVFGVICNMFKSSFAYLYTTTNNIINQIPTPYMVIDAAFNGVNSVILNIKESGGLAKYVINKYILDPANLIDVPNYIREAIKVGYTIYRNRLMRGGYNSDLYLNALFD